MVGSLMMHYFHGEKEEKEISFIYLSLRKFQICSSNKKRLIIIIIIIISIIFLQQLRD